MNRHKSIAVAACLHQPNPTKHLTECLPAKCGEGLTNHLSAIILSQRLFIYRRKKKNFLFLLSPKVFFRKIFLEGKIKIGRIKMVKINNTKSIFRKATDRFLKKSNKKLRTKRERAFLKKINNEI